MFKKYTNLVKEVIVTAIEELWVADITYIELENQFCYLSLITDAYSRKIVGYHLSDNLGAQGCVKALQMALLHRSKFTPGLIHHSDRGIQYCSTAYTEVLHKSEILISMTENGDPYENAMAERVNGILKHEMGLNEVFVTFRHAEQNVDNAIYSYNNLRSHASCDYLTPDQAHEREGLLPKRWKKYPVKKPEC
jgi:putative transposase